MTPEDRAFLDALSLRLLEEKLRPDWLVKSVHHHGGLDAASLSRSDLLALLEGSYSGDWWEPVFTFSEMLAYFAGARQLQQHRWNDEATVTWAFAVLALADALEQSASNWELQFNLVIDSFLAVRESLDVEEGLWIMRRVFRSTGPQG
ncbi:MAG: hypothetical protein RBU21_25665 [FCB group bacterium]|nr:hypothetical protein [FCB group bacterium]